MKRYEKYILISFLIIMFVLMFIAFYRSTILIDGSPLTDYPCHIAISQNIRSNEVPVFYCNFVPPYKLYHLFVAAGSFLFSRNYELSSSLVLLISQILTFLLIIKIYEKEFKHSKTNYIEYLLLFLNLIIICLPFKGKLYLPQGSPNIWHNPTYIFVKPFGIISFYSFYIINFNKQNKLNKWYLVFIISTFLSSLAKPSFVMVFLPVAGIFVLYNLIKNNFKNIKYGIYMFLSVLPTLALLIYQYISINEFSAIKTMIGFGTFIRLDFISSVFSTLSCIIFPIIVFYKNKNNLTNHSDLIKLTIGTTIMGWLQYYFLYQEKIVSGDYAWGYFWAISMLYTLTTYIFLENKPKKIDIQFLILFIQVALGLVYFLNYLINFNYLTNIF